ncbi:MAG: ABC transporter permease [Verrucomicrobiae bacterium]|nr:ABC transporter permease [Verrucomicrobiae bacterium]MDW7980182.1 ABC transporter permease [Verrucomicrobiales bacterium]
MSRLPIELVLALRYLRPKRTFVSVITLISVLGVTLGVAVLIIVLSVMTGFGQQLREKILGFNAHLKVLAANGPLADYAYVMNVVLSNQHVRGVAPFVLGQVLVETQPDPAEPGAQALAAAPWVRGVDPVAETNVSVLPSSVVEGRFDLTGRSVLVGTEFARMLGVRIGDRLAVYSPRELAKMRKTRGTEAEEAVLPDDYEVRGIFDVGFFEYNASVIVTSLENAQEMYQLDDQVHGLFVMLKDPYMAERARIELEAVLGREYKITTWAEENATILNAVAVEKSVMFYLLFFIMIVAALCIMSALITFVVQKTREIGMLKAVGATNAQVAVVFLGQSAIVGVTGVIAGLGLGMLALAYRNEFLRFMNKLTGFELFPASIYGFVELPALVVTRDIVLICVSALVLCLLAGVLPAWNATRLQPVDALRHE